MAIVGPSAIIRSRASVTIDASSMITWFSGSRPVISKSIHTRLLFKNPPLEMLKFRVQKSRTLIIIPYLIARSQDRGPIKNSRDLALCAMVDKNTLHGEMGFIARCSGKHKREMCFLLCFFEFLSCISSCYRLQVLKFPAGPDGADSSCKKENRQ